MSRAMNVQEMIELLQRYDPATELTTLTDDGKAYPTYQPITGIELRKAVYDHEEETYLSSKHLDGNVELVLVLG